MSLPVATLLPGLSVANTGSPVFNPISVLDKLGQEDIRASGGIGFCMWEMRSLLERLRDFFREVMSTPDLLARAGTAQGTPGPIRIIALAAGERDRELLSRLAVEQGWVLHFAATSGEAWDALNESKAPIVLCDRGLPDADWRGVIRKMVSAPHLVCAILISSVTDDYLWNEVISWGGHDLLATPLRQEDVLRAIRLAWSYWTSSMKVQPMLMKHYR